MSKEASRAPEDTYLPTYLEPFLYIMQMPDSFVVSVPAEMVAFRGFNWNRWRACAKQISQIFFHNRIFFINYTGRFIENYMYHIIRLHFLVDWGFLQVHIFIYIGFAVVLGYHGPQG